MLYHRAYHNGGVCYVRWLIIFLFRAWKGVNISHHGSWRQSRLFDSSVWKLHKLSSRFKTLEASATDVWQEDLHSTLLLRYLGSKKIIFPTLCTPLLDSETQFSCISTSPVTMKQTVSSAAKFFEWTDIFNYAVTWLNNHARRYDFQSKQMGLWRNLDSPSWLAWMLRVPEYEQVLSHKW